MRSTEEVTGLQTTAEEVGQDRVKLRVEVPEAALEPAVASVYRRWANEIKVPGFRKGKVPRQIIDTRVGPEVIRDEALREALPGLYGSALRSEDIEAIGTPEINIVEFEQGAPLVFEATVEVRPDVVVPDFASIEVEAPTADVTDEDIGAQLERLRDRFAELDTVGREARAGDFALIDLKAYRHQELMEGASAPDYLYELGSQSGPPKLDGELEGTRPGAILKFADTVPEGAPMGGEELLFTVLVKEIKAKRLPELDDEFAKTVGEFDSLDELRDDLRNRLEDVKRQMVADEVRGMVLAALVGASALDPPESLVEHEFEHRWEHFLADLKRANLTIDAYEQQTEMTELEIRKDFRTNARSAVKAELLLEQIARDRNIEVGQEDLGREIALAAVQSGRDPKEVAQELSKSGRLGSVAADIIRRKALDYVVENVKVINRPVDIEGKSSDDDSWTGPTTSVEA